MKLRLLLGIGFTICLLWIFTTIVFAQGETPAAYAGQKNPFSWSDTSAQAAGKEIYLRSCRSCHGASGGNILQFDFSAIKFARQLEISPDFYFWKVSEGQTDEGMPAYKDMLSKEQRWQVLTYVRSLGIKTDEQIATLPLIGVELVNGALPACYICHTRVLKSHDVFGEGVFRSGPEACLTCHSSTNMGKLRLLDGTELSQLDSPKLCAQCHPDKYKAWQNRTHGFVAKNSEDSGIPANVLPKCANCHDPHQPKISETAANTPPPAEPLINGKLDCLACHVRELKGHDKLGSGSAACWACHSDTEMNTLRLAGGGTLLTFSQSPQLCSQCHQQRYQDWLDGTHGVPGWKAGQPALFGSERVICANCHDPHQPQISYQKITKPHPELTPSSPEPPRTLLAFLGVAILGVIVIGTAATRGQES